MSRRHNQWMYNNKVIRQIPHSLCRNKRTYIYILVRLCYVYVPLWYVVVVVVVVRLLLSPAPKRSARTPHHHQHTHRHTDKVCARAWCATTTPNHHCVHLHFWHWLVHLEMFRPPPPPLNSENRFVWCILFSALLYNIIEEETATTSGYS